MSGCDRELNAHFYIAASLKYYVPDIWHDTTPSHIILTLGRPVLALPRKSEAKREAASTIFNDFGMSRPGIEPVTSRSPERTLYQLSYRGRYIKFRMYFNSSGIHTSLIICKAGNWLSIRIPMSNCLPSSPRHHCLDLQTGTDSDLHSPWLIFCFEN